MQKGQRAPRKRTIGLRAQAWWVIRKNKSTTLTELMLTVCTGEEKNAETNLRGWLNRLTHVGLLTRQRIKDGSNGTFQYSLNNDIGSLAPVVRKNGVYDPNANAMLEVSA